MNQKKNLMGWRRHEPERSEWFMAAPADRYPNLHPPADRPPRRRFHCGLKPTPRFDQPQIGHLDSNISYSHLMIHLLRQRLREFNLRRRHRAALRKVRVIEAMELPEDLKLAAVGRVMRRMEEDLAEFTSKS